MEFLEAYADLKADSAEGFANPILPVDDEHPANIRISERPDGMGGHYLMLDLDVPHVYEPSSTPGHGHLIVDVSLTLDELLAILAMLARVGVVEPGYYKGTEIRGAASLRLPHVRKEVTA